MKHGVELDITERDLQRLIFDSLLEGYMLEEGIWDDVSAGVKRLSAYVTKHFSKMAGRWAATISQSLQKLSGTHAEAARIIKVLQAAAKDTGESFQMNDALRSAKDLGAAGASALQTVQADLEGSVRQKAAAAQVKAEGRYLPEIYAVLAETPRVGRPALLREDLGVTSVIGMGLAVMGGLPLLFKGLKKLARVLGATGAAELFERAEHVTHHFEEKTVEFVMPTRLAYAVYVGLWKMGIKLSDGPQPIGADGIQTPEGKAALKKAKHLAYKVLLIYFAIQGIAGALKAGASLLGFVEGTATTVKGVELARGAEEVIKLVRAGSAAA